MEIANIQVFINYYRRLRERTMRVVSCIPPDKIEWTYCEGKFTLGDLVRHLAILEKNMWAPIADGRTMQDPDCGIQLAEGFEQVVAFIEEAHQEAIRVFSRLTPEQLVQKCVTPGGASMTTWKWLRAMCEHEVHHRGNIYTYLGMLGVETPPLYGRTFEELVEIHRGEQA